MRGVDVSFWGNLWWSLGVRLVVLSFCSLSDRSRQGKIHHKVSAKAIRGRVGKTRSQFGKSSRWTESSNVEICYEYIDTKGAQGERSETCRETSISGKVAMVNGHAVLRQRRLCHV